MKRNKVGRPKGSTKRTQNECRKDTATERLKRFPKEMERRDYMLNNDLRTAYRIIRKGGKMTDEQRERILLALEHACNAVEDGRKNDQTNVAFIRGMERAIEAMGNDN